LGEGKAPSPINNDKNISNLDLHNNCNCFNSLSTIYFLQRTKNSKKKKMIGEFLSIIVRSIKLDKTLYKDNKNFGEAAIYYAGLIMILDGIAGAVAANTIIKTAIALSGLTAIFTWFVWALIIFVVGVKLFPDKETKIPFKKILIGVGFAHAPGILRFFAVTPDLMIPIIFLTQFWIFAGLIISTKQILNLRSNFKSFGIVFLSFLIIAFLSISFVMSKMTALPISQTS
jgi:hypothetical protein